MTTHFSRRHWLTTTATILGSSPFWAHAAEKSAAPRFELPALPWDAAALDPVISASTIGQHHGKHHAAYVNNLNRLLPSSPLMDASSLVDVIQRSARNDAQRAIFNNAAQVWNHTFYWQSLRPKGGGTPPSELAKRIDADFGSLAALREATLSASTDQFGAGWVWLVLDKTQKKLAVVKTGNADTPLTQENLVPLATIDVWEHAYYLDYQSRRKDYAAAVFDKLLNWDFVAANLAKA
ncbi:MAG: superoxide dismutase [Aquabacterium sp.]|uniref:superoxide dismutase n=1 Tax=Aquabacterium sp. TaxID=1872578 RepID=UPI0027272752|nr:superoxide dismutase [Aquabacterium sp.]MDO9004829.1 superoxide dismutase [Aquabacterium sp.]